jgi:2-hydroxy-3-oxopropionate reductase
MSTPMTVGFVGTGIMGSHMARRLVEGGHRVRAWNRTPDKAERLGQHGVQLGDSAADTAAMRTS